MDRIIPYSTERITQDYNPPYHNGIDLGWRSDEEMNKVYSNSKGKVVRVVTGIPPMPASSGSYGNYVKIDHYNGKYSLYAHLRDVYVSEGQEVEYTTSIGLMGESGATIDSEGIAERHLHFEVFNGDSKINPTPYLTESIYSGDPSPSGDYFDYTIQSGDTLSEIAESFNTTVDILCTINGISNPDLIYAGDIIKIPCNNEEYYTIKIGDTLSEIAVMFNTTVQRLCELNNITNPDLIYAGDTIRVR